MINNPKTPEKQKTQYFGQGHNNNSRLAMPCYNGGENTEKKSLRTRFVFPPSLSPCRLRQKQIDDLRRKKKGPPGKRVVGTLSALGRKLNRLTAQEDPELATDDRIEIQDDEEDEDEARDYLCARSCSDAIHTTRVVTRSPCRVVVPEVVLCFVFCVLFRQGDDGDVRTCV